MKTKMWSGSLVTCKSVSASRPHHVVMHVVIPMLGLELLPTEDRRLVLDESVLAPG